MAETNNTVTISLADYEELLAARFKINMICNFMEDSRYSILADDDLRRILGIPKGAAHDLG